MQDKFVPTGSKRLLAYQRLGLMPKRQLDHMLDKHLPSTVVSLPKSVNGGGGGSGGGGSGGGGGGGGSGA